MEKLTNKQHTDYCEILNNFRCKAIDIIDELTKDYKNTLAEEIDSKLNDYHTHNEYLICELNKLEQENEQLKQTIATLHQNIRNGSIKDIEEMNELKEENKELQERIAVLEEALFQESKKYCKDSNYAHLQCDLLEERAKERIEQTKDNKLCQN